MQRFQTSDIPVFLLTSQVGGLGLTLTAADRVVIVVRVFLLSLHSTEPWC